MDQNPALESDESLMTQVSKGNLNGFEILVKRHQNKVYRLILHMLHQEEEAWDVAQEVFLKIYNSRQSYAENAKFTTWLYRIATNAAIDRIRQLRRDQKVQGLEEHEEFVSEDHGPQDQLQIQEARQQLERALAKLSERQRGMVIMKYYEGFAVNEIAEVFDCAAGTVKATLFQAVRNLRDHLGQLGIADAEVIK
ncbi:MAG: RNA polymerase sigma factor [Acidobacteria bacterium]|nr:RNA polymerase sigma factor [Acidobacteriota bacterium]